MEAWSEGSTASRFLNGLANALLARTLPTLREWLTARLGPSASIAHMAIDGASMRLERALVPLGSRMELEVRHAVFALTSDLVRGGAPIRLRELQGELRSTPAAGAAPFRAPVWFEPAESASLDAWVDGRLLTRGATWPVRAGVGQQAPLDGVVDLHVTSSAWSMANGELTSAASRVRLDARGSVDDPSRGLVSARLVASEARAGHFVDALAALAGTVPEVVAALPWDALVDCEIGFELGGAGKIELRARTSSGSTFEVRGASPDGDAIEAELRGTLSASEPILPSASRPYLAALGVRTIDVTCTARGTLDALRLEASLVDATSGVAVTLDVRADRRERLEGHARITTRTSNVSVEPLRVSRAGLLPGVRLQGAVSIRDALAFGWFGPGPVLPRPEGTIRGELSVEGAPGAFVVEGPVRAERIALAWSGREHAAPITLGDAKGSLRLDADRFALRGLEAGLADGSLHGDLTIPFGPADPSPRIVARISRAGAALIERAIEWSAATPEALESITWLARAPADARCDLELAWAATGAVRSRVRVASVGTDVSIDLKISADRRLRGTTFEGRVDVAEWARLERVEGVEAAWLQSALVVELQGYASGPIDDPIASVRTKVASVAFTHPSIRLSLPIRLEGIEVRLMIDRQRLAWEEGAIRGYGGSATSSGVWSWAGRDVGLTARARLDGVVVERLPIGVDGEPIGSWIRGRAAADVRLSSRGGGPLAASATVAIDSAELHALDLVAPRLSKLDLPSPSMTTIRPLGLEVAYQRGDVRIESIDVDVGDGAASGTVALDRNGNVRGELAVRLRRRWLSRSALLFVPASFTGDVVVPVSLSGTRSAVKVDYELEAALQRALHEGPIGRVIGDVLGAPSPRARRTIARAPSRPLSEEDVLDRVLDGVAGADAQLIELMERGYEPREISAKLDARLLHRRAIRR